MWVKIKLQQDPQYVVCELFYLNLHIIGDLKEGCVLAGHVKAAVCVSYFSFI